TLTRGIGIILNDDSTVGGAGNPIYTSFAAQPVDLNSILVKSTYFGDADLTGAVDGTDYFLIDTGFANHYSGWINGDFDYTGTIDGTDYFLIDNAFANQGAPLSPSLSGASAVPEPASLGLFAVA